MKPRKKPKVIKQLDVLKKVRKAMPRSTEIIKSKRVKREREAREQDEIDMRDLSA